MVLKIECLDATVRITNINKTMFGNRAMYKHKILTYKRVKLFPPISLDDGRQRAADAGLIVYSRLKRRKKCNKLCEPQRLINVFLKKNSSLFIYIYYDFSL